MAAVFVQDYETFGLGDFTLQHGDTLKNAKLAYKTFGELNADKSNAIVYLSSPAFFGPGSYWSYATSWLFNQAS
jgi:homoserine O-acetyltransferase